MSMPRSRRSALRGQLPVSACGVVKGRSRRGERQVIVDLDATLVTAHSDKQGATPTFKYTYGFHPMLAFVDHGAGGSGEALAGMLRPGSAAVQQRR